MGVRLIPSLDLFWRVEFRFECGCGNEVVGVTRGHDERFDTRISCPECETVYAVSLTTIERGYERESEVEQE